MVIVAVKFVRLMSAAAIAASSSVLLSVSEAHAYIDPGSGSVALQALVGMAAAGLVALRLFFRRVGGRFGRRSRDTQPGAGGGQHEQPDANASKHS